MKIDRCCASDKNCWQDRNALSRNETQQKAADSMWLRSIEHQKNGVNGVKTETKKSLGYLSYNIFLKVHYSWKNESQWS